LIDSLRGDLYKCDECSVKLACIPIVAAPAAVVDLSRLLIEKVCVLPAPSNRVLRQLSRPAVPGDLNLIDFQNLVAVIGLYGDPNAPLRSTHARDNESLELTWSVTSLAAEVLAAWPNGFRRLLDWLRSTNDDGSTHRLGHRFGRLYGGLFRVLGESQFECVHAQVEEYLREHWPALMHRRRGRFGTGRLDQRWVLAAEVENRFGISRMTLEDLITRGVLLADKRTTPAGRSRLMVERDSLVAFESSGARDVVSLTIAAHVLGICEKRLRGLVRALMPGAWRCSNGQWRIPKTDIGAITGCANAWTQVGNIDPSLEVTFSGVLRYHNVSDGDVVWIIEAVRAGRKGLATTVMQGLRGVGAWIFNREILKQLLLESREHRKSPLGFALSLPELARRWRLKQEVVYTLCNSGFLLNVS
jgi:hypothetical protein